MADTFVRELVWNGEIPLEIHLNDPENILIDSTKDSLIHQPFYMMAKRISYFPLLINEIKRHFDSISRGNLLLKRSVSNEFDLSELDMADSCMKAESSTSFIGSHKQFVCFTVVINETEVTLPWHLPIGHLYDLCESIYVNFAASAQNLNTLPWRITFKISSACDSQPSDSSLSHSYQISPCVPVSLLNLEDSMSAIFFSSLKESDYLRTGSSKNVMNLSRSEQIQLWESLKSNHLDRFWRINNKLISPATTAINMLNSKNLPIKFWIIQQDSGLVQKLQIPIPAISSENINDNNSRSSTNTLESILNTEFPDDNFIKNRLIEIRSHGVSIPIQTSLEELSVNFAFADNFLNLILIIKK